MITRTPHNSSLIQAVSHDPETNMCHVELLRGGTYAYHDVPAEHVDEMNKADSVGKHFNSVFKAAHGHKAKKVS